jgi:hypothetical protein
MVSSESKNKKEGITNQRIGKEIYIEPAFSLVGITTT